MYSVLIVDDEAIIRNSLESLLRRTENPFIGEIRCCASAEDALAACEQWPPDIVITDIVMGGRNGIDLISTMRQTLPGARFLVISGYDDFKYAHDAFMAGALDYLLKPVLYPQFKRSIDRICGELEQDVRARLSDAFQQFVDDMRARSSEDNAFVRLPGIDPSELITLAMFAFPFADSGEIDRALASPAFVSLVANAALCKRGSIAHLLYTEQVDLTGMLAGPFSGLSSSKCPAVVWETCIADGLHHCFRRLNKRLASRLREGYGRVIEDNSAGADGANAAPDVLATMQSYVKSVQAGNLDTVCDGVSELFRQTPSSSLEWLYQAFASMVRARIVERGFTNDTGLPPFSQFLTEAELHDALCKAMRTLTRFDSVEYAGLMARIERYIEDNYSRRLTLYEVAEHFAVSYAHLSHIISKAKNMSFTDWLTEVRMRHARELLYHPALSMQEISAKCGYENQFTFARAFKKYYGTSPSGYRKALDDTHIE